MRNHRHSRDWSVSVVDRSFALPLCRWCLTWESWWYLCNTDILISLTYLFSPSMSTLPIKIILARKSDLVSSPSSYSIVPPVLSTSMLLTFTLRYHENMWAAAVDTKKDSPSWFGELSSNSRWWLRFCVKLSALCCCSFFFWEWESCFIATS